MPEFLRLLPPDEARSVLFAHLPGPTGQSEFVETQAALGRTVSEDVRAPHPLPEFPRSTVDGYAVRARDTFGATDSMPTYLNLSGEIPMGAAPALALRDGQCALIHTGGMLPESADAVVMLEHTQIARKSSAGPDISGSFRRAESGTGWGNDPRGEVEILKAVAEGENIIRVGEEAQAGKVVISRGTRLRPAEIGVLMALGVTRLPIMQKPRIGLIASGDEVVPPNQRPLRGQVRDVNSYALAALIVKYGGEPTRYGIAGDEPRILEEMASKAMKESAALVISAGSSASARDRTAEVINGLGRPGVLVHGINTRPGKPTILGVCDNIAVIGLPGNPVSALINGYLFVAPLIESLLGLPADRPRASISARLTLNLPSQAGREDWWPVKLTHHSVSEHGEQIAPEAKSEWMAEPIFGQSNMILRLAAADGLVRIDAEVTGLAAGQMVEVFLI